MFWGLIMEPQRRYTQKVKKSFHISMAALDISTSSEEAAQVMCGFEGRNYLLCTLRKPDTLQCPLDLNFEVGDEISLAANGKCHVHLTGYLTDELNDLMGEEEEEDEVEEESTNKNKKRNKSQAVENGPPKKKSRVSSAEEDDEDSEDDDDSDIDVKDLLGKSLDEDDEDDSYASEDDDQAVEEEESDEEISEDEGSSLSGLDSDEKVEVDSKRSRKINGVSPRKEQASPTQKLSKKERKIKKQQEQEQNAEVKTPKKENLSPKKENLSPKKKTLQGGVIIDELKEGSGPPAKPGKFVHVYYEGRLKQNNKVFDSTNKGAGFSFRLGGGEVIKGWDVGVAGMKVGGRRRITCPPAMAYGQKGSPPTIPANSTLVFEVELKKIR